MSVRSYYRALGVSGNDGAMEDAVRPCFVCSHDRTRGGGDLVACIDWATGAWRCFRCGEGGGPLEAALALGLTQEDARVALVVHDISDGQATEEKPSPAGSNAQVHRSAIVEPTEPAPSPTDALVRSEALAREPDILACLATAARKAGLVGEDQRLKLLYLIGITRLFRRPVSAVIKGPSSAGKSFLVEQMLRFLPDSAAYALTAMSPRALAYSEEPLVHRILVVYEAPGMDSEMASYLMRSLLSEGELRYETVISTSSGLRPQLIHRPGPTGLITTTTAVALHEENETRLVSIPVTDSAEQTKAIMRATATGPGDPPDLTSWLALQAHLEDLAPADVTIPFAPTLADAIPAVAVRQRRDFSTLITLIEAHALLHAANRDRDAGGAVVASLEDYRAVRELVADLMAEGVELGVPLAVRETVSAVCTLTETAATTSVRKVAEALGLDRTSANRRVNQALARGYLRNASEKTGPGRALKLQLGESLPTERHVLPTFEDMLDLCTCAPSPGGSTPAPYALESESVDRSTEHPATPGEDDLLRWEELAAT